MHDHIIRFLIIHRPHFEALLSQKTVGSIADFIFGYSVASGMQNHLLRGFRNWLGVELGIFKPSTPRRGGIWIGPEINWQTMLSQYYMTEAKSYEGFFIQYCKYGQRNRRFIKRFELPSPVRPTYIVLDWGDGFPIALSAFEIEGHSGVYAEAHFSGGKCEQVGYFSSVEEIELAVHAALIPEP